MIKAQYDCIQHDRFSKEKDEIPPNPCSDTRHWYHCSGYIGDDEYADHD